jgi:hypothetical protein
MIFLVTVLKRRTMQMSESLALKTVNIGITIA